MRRIYFSLVEDWTGHVGDRVFVGYLEDMASDPVHVRPLRLRVDGLTAAAMTRCFAPYIDRYQLPQEGRA